MSTTLYAWANPLSPESIIGSLDHTWVTNYPFTNNQYPTIKDIPTDGNYWYCWGSYHPSGEGGIDHKPNGAIGNQQGDLTMSTALVTPNIEPPKYPGDDAPQDGSIFYYGVDGVCHMVANQALFSTGISNATPLRVTDANAYPLSSFLYTDYSLNTAVWEILKEKHAPTITQPADYFIQYLDSMGFTEVQQVAVLENRTEAHTKFSTLHKEITKHIEEHGSAGKIYTAIIFATIASIVYDTLSAVHEAIGKENFFKLFPSFQKMPTTKEEAIYFIEEEQLLQSLQSAEKIHAARRKNAY